MRNLLLREKLISVSAFFDQHEILIVAHTSPRMSRYVCQNQNPGNRCARVIAVLRRSATIAIGPANHAGAPSDEGIDRYFSVGFVSPRSSRRREAGRSERMKPTWAGAKRAQTGAEDGGAWQCSPVPREIQPSSFASCCRDVP